jgi:hypothetical protein
LVCERAMLSSFLAYVERCIVMCMRAELVHRKVSES